MADLNELGAEEIGRRLRIARENAGIRQDDAAAAIDTSRPTLVSIEQGVRRARMPELQILANRYGMSVNALLRREAIHTDLVSRFRKLRETEDGHSLEAIRLLNDLANAETELENILGIKRRGEYSLRLMAHAAWKRDLMSEGQLAELLKIGRVELRKLVDEIELEESDTDDLLKLPN